MEPDNIHEEVAGVVFENGGPVLNSPALETAPLAREKGLAANPATPRVYLSQNAIHWIILLLVLIFCTGIILFFVFSFAKEIIPAGK